MVEGEIIMLGKRSGVRKAFKTVGIIIFILWMFIILLIADNYTIRCFVYELQDQQKWNEKRLTLLLEIEEHKVKEEQP